MFTSIFNFRDLGGTVTSTGNVVRPGRLYRSDSLAKLTHADTEKFASLGIRTVIDLQRPDEVAALGRIPDAPGRRYINIAPKHDLWDPEPYDRVAGPPRYLADRYLEMARDGQAGFVRALTLLADAESAPAVVHCFAGKDRTGVLIALTLGLLGVADDAIADDYAISESWSATHAPAEMPRHWVVAPRDAMLLFLSDFRRAHLSIDAYVAAAGCGPDRVANLRAHLLS